MKSHAVQTLLQLEHWWDGLPFLVYSHVEQWNIFFIFRRQQTYLVKTGESECLDMTYHFKKNQLCVYKKNEQPLILHFFVFLFRGALHGTKIWTLFLFHLCPLGGSQRTRLALCCVFLLPCPPLSSPSLDFHLLGAVCEGGWLAFRVSHLIGL